MLTDAISFLGSALFLLRIRKQEEVVEPAVPAEKQGMRAEAGRACVRMEGPAAPGTHRELGDLQLLRNGAFAVYLVYAVRSLGLSPAAIGVIFSLGNVGWLVGALVAGRLSARLGVGMTIIVSGAVAAPALMLVPAAPASAPIPFLIAAGVLSSFGLVIWRITQVSLRQSITPHHMLGRVNAVSRFLMWGTIPLGTLLGGALGSTIGLRTTLWIGTIGASFTILPVLCRLCARCSRSPTRPKSRTGRCWSRRSAWRRSEWMRPMRSLWPHGGLWRHPDFLKLWSGQTVSQFGSQVSGLALPLAALLVLDASAFEVALLGTVEFLPFFLFALPAGVWVDRLRRRPILIVTDVCRGLVLASIPVAYLWTR